MVRTHSLVTERMRSHHLGLDGEILIFITSDFFFKKSCYIYIYDESREKSHIGMLVFPLNYSILSKILPKNFRK